MLGRRIEASVRGLTLSRGARPLVLAVSGGRDSMALLHAAARVVPDAVAVVATFDHGTGAAARRASAHVAGVAGTLGLPVVIGHAAARGTSEAEWRDARRGFLAEVAAGVGGGTVVTAHTRDDQVETVFMRVLRRAGPRGLAGLYASTDVARPLLEFSRDEIADYARDVGASWVDDPTNDSMKYFRNRVRRDLLPALARAEPGFERQLIEVARSAWEWRERVDALVGPLTDVDADEQSVRVHASALRPYSTEELQLVWPAIAARVGLAMDWRGTERASAFTNRSRTGTRIQLSGGWEIVRSREYFELRRWR